MGEMYCDCNHRTINSIIILSPSCNAHLDGIPWNHEFAWYGERRTRLNSFREVQPLSHCSYLKEEGEREREREGWGRENMR